MVWRWQPDPRGWQIWGRQKSEETILILKCGGSHSPANACEAEQRWEQFSLGAAKCSRQRQRASGEPGLVLISHPGLYEKEESVASEEGGLDELFSGNKAPVSSHRSVWQARGPCSLSASRRRCGKDSCEWMPKVILGKILVLAEKPWCIHRCLSNQTGSGEGFSG